ncbi:MAG: hypothetical protein LJE94_08495 [Deltaproteobacteria bacterium]|nr:hypothetical protein [Deltaproteobacteria bacterium]
MQTTTVYKKLDFEVGHLIKSPCSGCDDRVNFPGCYKSCRLLRHIQQILAEAVSCTQHFSSLESSALSLEGWRK